MLRLKHSLISAFIISFALSGISYAENFTAWDLNAKINSELKQNFMSMRELNITAENLHALREAFIPEKLPKNENVEVHDEIIGRNLRVRIYTPKSEQKEFPALLWIHGGGHILGAPEQDEALLLRIASEINCIIAAPDYSLAPENKYPADVDDCFEALKWMCGNLPVIKDKIAVAGQSAGGGLTAAIALRARDEGGPALCFQMPLYPMLDCRNITPSSFQIVDHRVWNRDFNITAWGMYLGDDVNGYASPALAEDLAGLPPAFIMVGELDPFRDEAITYSQRLLQAGVAVELHVVPGVFHGFEMYFPDSEIGKRAINEYVNALAQALK